MEYDGTEDVKNICIVCCPMVRKGVFAPLSWNVNRSVSEQAPSSWAVGSQTEVIELLALGKTGETLLTIVKAGTEA